jgi:hypothetical protein
VIRVPRDLRLGLSLAHGLLHHLKSQNEDMPAHRASAGALAGAAPLVLLLLLAPGPARGARLPALNPAIREAVAANGEASMQVGAEGAADRCTPPVASVEAARGRHAGCAQTARRQSSHPGSHTETHRGTQPHIDARRHAPPTAPPPPHPPDCRASASL